MSKPKLNLQIRSASFKENGHAGTGNQKKLLMQLQKDRWKTEHNEGVLQKCNDSLDSKTEKFKTDCLPSSAKSPVKVGAKIVKSISLTDKHLIPKEESEIRYENIYKSAVKSNLNGAIGNSSNYATKVVVNEVEPTTKRDENGAIDTQTKILDNTGTSPKMKIEIKTSSVTSVEETNSSSLDSEKTFKSSTGNNRGTGKSSITYGQNKIADTDTLVNNEPQLQFSPMRSNASQKKDINVNKMDKVPYSKSPTVLDSETSSSNMKQPNPVLVDIELIQNSSQSSKDIKKIDNSECSSETGESCSSKTELPGKHTGHDDPVSVIEELETYLRNKFGSIVNETYTQVGETQTISENSEANSALRPEAATSLSFPSETVSNRTSGVSTPTSPVDKRAETFIPHPIFFKTSVKKDPGSKLHDALVSELSTVLKKRDDPSGASKENDNDTSNSEKDKTKFPRKRISAKGNKVLGNKALLATLEDHLTKTLHKNKIFQRQSLKVLGLDTIEVNQENKTGETKQDFIVTYDPKTGIPLPPPPPNVPHYGAVPLNITPKKTEGTEKTNAKILENDTEASENSEKKSVDKKDSINASKADANYVQETRKTRSELDKDDELLIYTYEHPGGKTEGVVCSVETKDSPENSGKTRKYITCVNIVAEKSGCPFIQTVDDGGMPTASGGGLYFAEEDKPAVFNIDVGKRKGDLGVHVQGPHSVAKYSVDQQADGSFMVTYIPVEVGLFDINVTWNGKDIAGSPYHPKVIDSRKVKVIGGWQHFMDSNERISLVVGERKQLPFDISEAGPGTLRAEVSGPSGSFEADIDTYTHGKNVVEFTPREEGNHYIHIFWSDAALVNSPFLGYAVPQHPDASKIILTGRGLREAVVREEAEFMIDGSQAGQGAPEVTLTGIKAEVNVRIVPVGNGRFKCSYIPVVPGAYLLHINWNGRQLRGSPYKVNVIGAFYPNKVIVSGEGIHGGILGREIDVRIDTRKAGPGELTAYCMGPRQVAVCELTDNHDGTFRLGIRPKESGRHVLQVKYGGEHVQGSPFIIKVTAQPDASKVRVVGPGVEHGILATFVSRFIVETKGAGAGQLTVRIRGPKGGFQVEMYRDSQRDRTILCRYDPTECGLYIISVKWSGVDVPGSPFHVHILDTQEELEQVLNEVSYSIKTGGSHGGSQLSHGVPQRLAYSQWRESI